MGENKKNRDSLIFYRSFYEAIKELPEDMKAITYEAIFEYSLNFNEVALTGLPKTIFKLIKPQLDANNKRFENGKKGGRKKQEETETEPKNNQNQTKTEANNNVNVNNNANANENQNKNIVKRFTPPTLDLVISYFTENGYTEQSAKKAFDYYTVADWKDSKGNKVKNWKQKMQGVWFKPENELRKINAIPAHNPNKPLIQL